MRDRGLDFCLSVWWSTKVQVEAEGNGLENESLDTYKFASLVV